MCNAIKRKRLLLVFGCLAGVLLAGYATLRLTAPRHEINEKNIEAIKRGMTEEKVVAILCAPAGVYSAKAGTGHYPIFATLEMGQKIPFIIHGDGTVYFEGKGLISEWGGKEWVGEEICIYVRFDENGRVTETLKGLVFPQWDESFLAKLRRWLGM